MKRVFLLIALVLCVQWTFAQNCGQFHDDCERCQAEQGCGFCGVYGFGLCMQGNKDGSTETVDGISECPNSFWKFDGESCRDPVREITVKETRNTTTQQIIKYEWNSVAIFGQGKGKIPTFDAVSFFMGVEDEKTGDRYIGVGVGFANGLLGDTDTEIRIFWTAFDNIFEFVDVNSDGLDINDLTANNEWLPLYEINSFSSFAYTVTDVPNVDNGLLYTATALTSDGKFKTICRVGNTDWDYTVPNSGGRIIKINPYQMKCDVELNNWTYRSHPSNPNRAPSIGIQGFVVSATFNLELDPAAQNDNALQSGEVSFGEGVGFFRWAKNVQGKTSPTSSEKDYPVLVTDIDLPDVQDPDFPPGTLFKTTIFTISNANDTIVSFNWDPVSGIDPIRATPYVSLASGRMEMSMLLLSICLLLAAVFRF